MLNEIHLGDCLDVMTHTPSGSVDMILCDLPYGTTACKWDTVIPFEPLWAEYERIIRPHGAIVLTASQPFTSALVMSNPKWFKYCWVWEKPPAAFMSAKFQPLKSHEDVVVFSSGGANNGTTKPMPYFPQDLVRINATKKNGTKKGRETLAIGANNCLVTKEEYQQEFTNYPKSILPFGRDKEKLHPTQKPVALFEYLIKTYTNPGEVVLDNCIGSGTTAIAALNTGRQFIGIERDPQYHLLAVERVEQHRLSLLPAWLQPLR